MHKRVNERTIEVDSIEHTDLDFFDFPRILFFGGFNL